MYMPPNVEYQNTTSGSPPIILGVIPFENDYYSTRDSCRVPIKMSIDLSSSVNLTVYTNSKINFTSTFQSNLIEFTLTTYNSDQRVLFDLELENVATGSKAIVRNFLNVSCTTIKNPFPNIEQTSFMETTKGFEASIRLNLKGSKIYNEIITCETDCYECITNLVGSTVDSNLTITLLPPKYYNCGLQSLTTMTIKITAKSDTSTSGVSLFYPLLLQHNFEVQSTYPQVPSPINVYQDSDSHRLGVTLLTKTMVKGLYSTMIFNSMEWVLAYKVSNDLTDPSDPLTTYILKHQYKAPNSSDIQIQNQGYMFTIITSKILDLNLTLVPTTYSKQPFTYQMDPKAYIQLVANSVDNPYLGKELNTLILNSKPVVTLPLFYGYTKGTVKKFDFQVSEIFTMYFGTLLNYGFSSSPSVNINGDSDKLPDNVKPSIEQAKILLIEGVYKIFLMVSDVGSGIRFYKLENQIQEIYKYLVNGNSNRGSYLIPFDPSKSSVITVYDANLNEDALQLRSPTFLSSSLSYFSGSHDYCNILISDFTEFKFSNNLIDLSASNQTIYLQFNLSKPDRNFIPILSVMLFKDFYVDYQGGWNSTMSMYLIPINLPKRLNPDYLSYRFKNLMMGGGSKMIDMTDLFIVFSEVARLKVNTIKSDVMPPLVYQLIPFTDLTSTPVPTVGWIIRFIDENNGFKDANITVTGDYDKVPHVFHLKVEDRNPGSSIEIPQFEIRIPISTFKYQDEVFCQPQIYTIVSITAQDLGAGFGSVEYIDPLFNFVFSPKNYSVSYSCTQQSTPAVYLDSTPPKIESFNCQTTTINSHSLDRVFQVDFEVSDESGINTRISPIVFIHSQFMTPIGFQSEQIMSNSTHSSFTAKVLVPFNYGNDYILLSVGRVMDRFFNLRGSSYYELHQMENSKVELIKVNNEQSPILDYHSKVDRSYQDTITIFGKNIGIGNTRKLNLMISKGSKDELVDPKNYIVTDYSSIILKLNPQNGDNFKVLVHQSYDDGLTFLASNYLDIYLNGIPEPTPSPSATPTQTPTTSPDPVILCKGSPLCSGHGDCLPTGCNCTSPYFGPDCNSKLVEIEPNIDPENPTSTGKDKDGSIQTIISIVSLREIDARNRVANEYNFTSWVLNNRTKLGSSDIHYEYTHQLKNELNTTIIVSAQFFSTETSIDFAGTTFTVSPSTFKYSISVSSYPFAQTVNQLQIVMEASIENQQTNETEDKSCSIQDLGTNQDSLQWIKLTINEKSLYGTFYQRGIVDNQNRLVSTSYLDGQSSPTYSKSTNSRIGINIPFFNDKVLLDPNFQVLVDQTSNRSRCKKSGLTVAQIAGIAVGSAMAFLIIVLIAAFIIKKKYKVVFKEKKINLITIK
eukprot:gene6822-8461_t